MLLAMDIGNSHTVMGLFESDRLAYHWRISTDPRRTADELLLLVEGLLRAADLRSNLVTGMIVSSVVPALTPVACEMAERHLGADPLVVGPGIKTGMPMLVENPREVGADRVVNSLAGYHLTRGATIVVDLGTAITLDVVDPQGRYLGGTIAPGLGLSLDALFSHTAKLPRVDLVAPAHVVGRNTVESIQAGVFFGAVSMVDGLVERIRGEIDDVDLTVIATGGYAERIGASSEAIDRVEPDLTLLGLRLIYERNS